MNPLSALLNLSLSEKLDRGLEHIPQEIAQQPETWLRTFEMLRARQQEIQAFLIEAGIRNPPEQRPTIFLIGAGTSDYIGHSLHHLLRSRWGCEVIPVASTDLLTSFSEYVLPEKRYLWISFSRSGDSPEGVAVLERALTECRNVSHLVVSCNPSGRIINAVTGYSNSFAIVLEDATNDRSLAMTSSFTNMVLAGQVLAHAWTLDQYEPINRALINAGHSFLPRAGNLASELATEGYSRACFVGSGILAGAAKECALKLLELTAGQLQVMAQSTLALRHGPMAALNRDTLFIALVSSDAERRKYDLGLLREISSKELVRTRVAVATAHLDSINREVDHVLAPMANGIIPDLYRPVLDVLFGQLLGLFTSIHLGLKPDVPSPNGAISRVVQSVGLF